MLEVVATSFLALLLLYPTISSLLSKLLILFCEIIVSKSFLGIQRQTFGSWFLSTGASPDVVLARQSYSGNSANLLRFFCANILTKMKL
jgi:hypothetical protein